MSLGDRMNGVERRPGFFYGLATRDGEKVTVAISGPTKEVIGSVTGNGWAGNDGVRVLAQRLVDRWVREHTVKCPHNERHWFTGPPGLRLPFCLRCGAPNPKPLNEDEWNEYAGYFGGPWEPLKRKEMWQHELKN